MLPRLVDYKSASASKKYQSLDVAKMLPGTNILHDLKRARIFLSLVDGTYLILMDIIVCYSVFNWDQ